MQALDFAHHGGDRRLPVALTGCGLDRDSVQLGPFGVFIQPEGQHRKGRHGL
ncbi:hypothetical protein ACFFX0_32610 [Citricoccus parietis]|uniref:Uncharacterized protein n=1 Tax=Citricoccus parietis TaxID=592307 RepID=A0ABV5G9N6_9MICC